MSTQVKMPSTYVSFEAILHYKVQVQLELIKHTYYLMQLTAL